jgi:hypothetical protein
MRGNTYCASFLKLDLTSQRKPGRAVILDRQQAGSFDDLRINAGSTYECPSKERAWVSSAP